MSEPQIKTTIRHLIIEDTHTNPIELEVLLCRNRYIFYELEPIKDKSGKIITTLEGIGKYLELK